MWIKPTITEQRKALVTLFEPVMLNIAKRCSVAWTNTEQLNQVLNAEFSSIPHCHLLYAIDKLGKQVSANVTSDTIDANYYGQDLSRRPYSVSLYPKRHFMLSSVYISQTTGSPCISAVQPVIDEQQFYGFIVADFDIRRLPQPIEDASKPFLLNIPIKNGDIVPIAASAPRVKSSLDQNLDPILNVLSTLISMHGIFHCTLHCSSGQAMLWHQDNPYQYHLCNTENLLSSSVYDMYRPMAYPEAALISAQQVQQVLERFRTLRMTDENVYLRSGSINIMNGMIGLSFSCDGSQYMAVDVFLNKHLSFWFGRGLAVAIVKHTAPN
jgi:hypothetical protein